MGISLKRSRIKKSAPYFVIGTTLSLLLSACAPDFNQTSVKKPTSHQYKVNDHLFAKVNGQDWNLNQTIQAYLKTPTGLKTLVSNFLNLLITNFYQALTNTPNQNATNAPVLTQFLGDLSSVDTNIATNLAKIHVDADKILDPEKKAAFLQSKYDEFGGNVARYQLFNASTQLRSHFITSLFTKSYLNFDHQEFPNIADLNDHNNWSKITFTNDQLTEPFAKMLAKFQQFLFDDWYQYTKPIPVVETTWKYADKDVKSNNQPILETVYNKDALSQKGITLPDAANYQFPAFDNVSTNSNNTTTKFDNFIKNFKELIKPSGLVSPLNNFSDSNDAGWNVVSLNDLGANSDFSSQKIAAILQVYNSHALGTQNIQPVNVLKVSAVDQKDILNNFLDHKDVAAGKPPMPGNPDYKDGIYFAGDVLLKKSTDADKTPKSGDDGGGVEAKNYVYDIRQLEQDPAANKPAPAKPEPPKPAAAKPVATKPEAAKPEAAKPEVAKPMALAQTQAAEAPAGKTNTDWVLYKDKNGAHALTLEGINQLANSQTANQAKQLLLYRAMLTKLNQPLSDQVKFDLIAKLKQYLNDHFDAIMLRYLISSYKNDDSTTVGGINKEDNPKNASVDNTNKFNGLLAVSSDNLFHGTYNPFWHNNHYGISANNNLVSLLTAASHYLDAQFFQDNLFSLRKQLVNSYQDFIQTEPFQKPESGSSDSTQTYLAPLKNGLASKLPYALAYDDKSATTNYKSYSNTNDGGYNDLEKLYFPNAQAAIPGTGTRQAGEVQSVAASTQANNKFYQDFFQPGTAQKQFTTYTSDVDKFFKNPFNTNFAYDDKLAAKKSQVLHFATTAATKSHQWMISQWWSGDLLEAIKVQASGNNDLVKLLEQSAYLPTVNNYFDYLNNSWKLTTNPDATFFKNYSTDFQNNYFLAYTAPTYLAAKVKQIYGGAELNSQTTDQTNYEKLLSKIAEQAAYIDDNWGYNLISDQQISNFKRFVAINWLLKDHLSNFRTYLMNQIGYHQVASFVWTNENRKGTNSNSTYGSKELSTTNSTSNTDYNFQANNWNLTTSPYYANHSFSAISSFNDPKNNWLFAKIQLDNTKSVSAVGFQGLITQTNVKDKLNSTIAPLIFANEQNSSTNQSQGVLSQWGNLSNLVAQIKEIATFDQLNKFVDQLATTYPNIDFSNVRRTTIQSPLNNSPVITLSLQQRVNALLNIVYGYNFEYRVDSEKIFLKSVDQIYYKAQTSSNSCGSSSDNATCFFTNGTYPFSAQAFQSFSGSIANKDNPSAAYGITSSSNSLTTYVAYQQQISYFDVATATAFQAYWNKVSADVWFQTLFAAANDPQVQQDAQFALLHSTKTPLIEAFDQTLAVGLPASFTKNNNPVNQSGN